MLARVPPTTLALLISCTCEPLNASITPLLVKMPPLAPESCKVPPSAPQNAVRIVDEIGRAPARLDDERRRLIGDDRAAVGENGLFVAQIPLP